MLNSITTFLTDYPLAQSLLTSLGLLIAYVMSVAWLRKKAGQARPRFKPEEVRFKETRVSAFSDRSMARKQAGARNSLVVTVLRDTVLIEPQSFLRLFIPPSMNEFELYLSMTDIHHVQPDTLFGFKTVKLKFRAHDRTLRTVTLMLKDQDGFVRAVRGGSG